jgi:hypothetical protein
MVFDFYPKSVPGRELVTASLIALALFTLLSAVLNSIKSLPRSPATIL